MQNVSYVLPSLDDVAANLQGKTCFSKLDVDAAFLTIPLAPEAKRLLGLQVPNADVRFAKLPFGCKIGTALFQKCHNEWLKGYINNLVTVYCDDVLISTESVEKMLESLPKILDRYRFYRVPLKASKCEFLLSKVKYLGVQFSKDGYKPDPKKRN